MKVVKNVAHVGLEQVANVKDDGPERRSQDWARLLDIAEENLIGVGIDHRSTVLEEDRGGNRETMLFKSQKRHAEP